MSDITPDAATAAAAAAAAAAEAAEAAEAADAAGVVAAVTAAEAAAAASSSSTPSKERHSLTLDQRRALRRWANSQTVRPSHKACIEWFQDQYNQTISQSTVSHSLSPKYARLDGDPQLSGSRLRFGNWPDVEKLVLLWHQQMQHAGRHPSNEELADKAKSIFSQLPRYKDEQPPEFSPGWIHRFKKRYGLLIRRQRRHGTAPNPADDIPYLVDMVPRFMSISADVSPAAIRDTIQRFVGVEASLATCARVRDEVVRRLENPALPPQPQLQPPPQHSPQTPQHQLSQPPTQQQQQQQHPHLHPHPHPHSGVGGGPSSSANGDASLYSAEDDPEVVLQNALRALQQEEADAEAEAAAAREERDRAERGLPPLGTIAGQAYAHHAAAAVSAMSTPVSTARASVVPAPGPSGGPAAVPGSGLTATPPPAATTTTARFIAPTPQPGAAAGGANGGAGDLTLTPIPSEPPVSATTDRPVRCPFCVNTRMLRTIKEAVEHMSTHVVV